MVIDKFDFPRNYKGGTEMKGKLINLYFRDGCYIARVEENGHFRGIRFIFYSRRGVINELRRVYKISCSHDFY